MRWQGVGTVVLLDFTDMLTLMMKCNVMGIRRVMGSKMLLTGSKRLEKTTDGIRVKMSARPLLERMNFDAALAAHLGTGFMDNFMIEQIRGGPNDGMFVAHDAVAQLMGMQPQHAVRKIKNIACPVPEPRNDQERQENRQKEENFSSYTLLKAGHGGVILVNNLYCIYLWY